MAIRVDSAPGISKLAIATKGRAEVPRLVKPVLQGRKA